MAEVQIIFPDGGHGTADEKDLPFLLERGFRVESTEDAVNRVTREQAGSGFQQFQAGAEGFVRGYTGGLSDVVFPDKEGARLRQEENPWTSGIAEVAGSLMPTGYGGLAARAGLAASERIGARVGSKVLGAAVGTGAAGALEGAGAGVSKAALAKDPQAVEDILATIGSSALYGGAAGAGLGAVGTLVTQGAKAGRISAVEHAAETAETASGTVADDILERLARRPGNDLAAQRAAKQDIIRLREIGDITKPVKKVPVSAEEMKEWKAGLDESLDRFGKVELPELASVGRQARARARKVIEEGKVEEYKLGSKPTADDSLEANLRASLKKPPPKKGTQPIDEADIVAVQGDKRAIQEAAAAYDAIAPQWEKRFGVGRKTVGGKPSKPNHVYSSSLSKDQIAKALQDPEAYALHQRYRDARLGLLQALNPSKAFVDLAPVEGSKAQAFARNLADAERRMAEAASAMDEPTLNVFQTQIDELMQTAQGKDTVALAKEADELAKRWGMKPPSREDLQALAGKAPLLPGGSLEAKYKLDFYQNAAKAVQKAQAEAGRAFVDKAGMVGSVVGGVAGLVKGGPIGAYVGADRGGAAGRFIANLWRNRDKARGKIQGGLSRFLGATDRAGRRAADALQSGIGTVAEKSARVQPAIAGAIASAVSYAEGGKKLVGKEAIKARADEITKAMQDPIGTRTKIHHALGWLWANDPELADQVEALAWKRLEFLAGKMPQRPPVDPFRPNVWHLADSEAERFARYIAAAEDPAGRAIEEMNAGRLTLETVETLQALAPETYGWMRSEIVKSIPTLREELPYTKRLTLGTLFQAPVDALQEANILVSLQEEFSLAAEAREENPSSKNEVGSVKLKPEPTPGQKQAAGM